MALRMALLIVLRVCFLPQSSLLLSVLNIDNGFISLCGVIMNWSFIVLFPSIWFHLPAISLDYSCGARSIYQEEYIKFYFVHCFLLRIRLLS